MKNNILYLRNLPPNISCNDLFEEFENNSNVISVYKKFHRRYAYIKFINIESAENAMTKFHCKYNISYALNYDEIIRKLFYYPNKFRNIINPNTRQIYN